jgi:hypothetical protein
MAWLLPFDWRSTGCRPLCWNAVRGWVVHAERKSSHGPAFGTMSVPPFTPLRRDRPSSRHFHSKSMV